MSAVASKNPYDLLGNDPEADSDREPEPPTKAVEKTLPRTVGRKAPESVPSAPRGGAGGDRGGRGGRRGGFTGSEEAFRDRTAGSTSNRGKDDGLRADRHPDRVARGSYEGRGRGMRGDRGGRGGRGPREGDRHSRTAIVDSEKQVNQGWGASKGDAEWKDEQAGEAIAQAEEKAEGWGENTEGGVAEAAKEEPAAEPEPEDNTKSYTEYLAELEEKRLHLDSTPAPRKPNEGSKQDKKWAKAKELKKDGEEEVFIAGAGGKAKRERQRKEKAVLEIDQRYVEPSRGGRDGGRGGRGRGEGRGDFRGGERGRGGRGRGEGRGDYRGSRGGPRGGGGAQVNVADTDAFPSLGK